MTIQNALQMRVSFIGYDQVKRQLNDLKRDHQGVASSVGVIASAHKAAAKEVRAAWGDAKNVVLGVAVAFGGLSVAAAGAFQIIKRFESAEAFRRGLKFNLGAQAGAAVANAADQFAVTSGQDLGATRQGVMKLSGTGELRADQLLPTLRAFQALALVSGATMDGTARAFEQYTQIASQGKLQGDELRAIQENGVQLRKLLKDSGFTGDTSKLTFKDINDALLKFAQRDDVKKIISERGQEGSARFQAALNLFQLKVIEPMGSKLAPVLSEISVGAGDFLKSFDPSVVVNWTKQVVDSARSVVEWGKENWDAIKAIGKLALELYATIRVMRIISGMVEAFNAFKNAVKGVSEAGAMGTLTASALAAAAALDKLALSAGGAGIAGTAGAAGVAGAAGAAGIAGVAAIAAAVLASAVVFASVYMLTKQVLDMIGYEKWLEENDIGKKVVNTATGGWVDKVEKWAAGTQDVDDLRRRRNLPPLNTKNPTRAQMNRADAYRNAQAMR